MSVPMEAGRFGSGHTVRRIEDPALVAGQGRFTDDLVRPNLAHVVFLRSPYAHARIVSIDTSAAREMPGVIAVLTGADLVQAGVKPMAAEIPFPRPDGKPAATAPRRALAHETVRYVGEAVAAVVAERPRTRDQRRRGGDGRVRGVARRRRGGARDGAGRAGAVACGP